MGQRAALAETFTDIDALAERCRFRDCRHREEPGCAVTAAVATGELPEARLESFQKLAAEQAHASASRISARRSKRSAAEGHRREGAGETTERQGASTLTATGSPPFAGTASSPRPTRRNVDHDERPHVSDARKTLGSGQALDGASFELRKGELLALLGPNGAGKTTLIRAIAGRVRLDGGEIRRLRSAGRRPARRRAELGIVPQEIALYPLLTARENLEAFGRLQGLSGAELAKQVDWALERTGLADRASEPVKQFSGGMRRRLNIACGILHRPRIVLLDEPTVGVDPQSRDRIYDMLGELAADGVSLLLTTHHLEEAEARCSRTVIIDHGRVIAAGTLAELVDQTVGRHRLVTLRSTRRSTAARPAAAASRSIRRTRAGPRADDRRRRASCRRCSSASAPPAEPSTTSTCAARACSRSSSTSPEGSCASDADAAAHRLDST